MHTLSVYLFFFGLLNINQNSVSYKVIGTKDRIVYGYSFLNITGLTMDQCLATCLQDCKCLSFQICEDDKTCQLRSSRREQSEESFELNEGCTSYVFERDQLLQKAMSGQKSCLQDTNCCLTSHPCQNGATCVFNPTTSIHNFRFTCKCRPGYQGVYCEQPIRSCRGYINNKGNNIYYVIDSKGEAYPVVCNFYANKFWTLIQSYKRENKHAIEASFKDDSPLNPDKPYKVPYRLPSLRMESIRQNSSIWRILHDEDSNSACWKNMHVTIDSRSKICTSCDVRKYVVRGSIVEDKCNPLANYDSDKCEDPLKGGNIDNFGLYCCASSKHECPSSFTVTARIWLGDTY